MNKGGKGADVKKITKLTIVLAALSIGVVALFFAETNKEEIVYQQPKVVVEKVSVQQKVKHLAPPVILEEKIATAEVAVDSNPKTPEKTGTVKINLTQIWG